MTATLTHDTSAPFGCILNPGANRSRAARRAGNVRAFLSQHFPGSEVYMTSSKEDIGRFAFEVSERFGRILVCGGDGTINEVMQVAMITGAQVAIVPMGSGNDFAKTPGISRNINLALEQVKTGRPLKIDLIRYQAETENGLVKGVVVNTLGLGFDGRTNAEAARMRRIKGPLMYAFAALKSARVSQPSRIHMEVGNRDDTSADLLMLTLANGRVEGGNFTISPDASLTDGWMDMVTVPPVSLFKLLTRLPLFVIGMQHLTTLVSHQNVRNVNLTLETPLPMHVDGEQVGLHISRLSAEVIPSAVHVLVPHQYEPTRPQRQ